MAYTGAGGGSAEEAIEVIFNKSVNFSLILKIYSVYFNKTGGKHYDVSIPYTQR